MGWSRADVRVLDRYARALADGRHRSLREASEKCLRELAALHSRTPLSIPGSVNSVRARLDKRFRRLKVARPMSHWNPAERRLAERFARAYVSGRFPTVTEAARQCLVLLVRESGRKVGVDAVRRRVREWVSAMGIPTRGMEWDRDEMRVANRWLRKMYTSPRLGLRDAARACSRELGGTRTPDAARKVLTMLAARVGLPRYHAVGTPEERELLESYARRVAVGEIESWREAAEMYHNELARRRARLARRAPKWVRRVYLRSVATIEIDLVHVARRLGLREPRSRRWAPEEDRLVAGWRRWYVRYRHVRRLKPLTQAAEGLMEELADRGFRRSIKACSIRIATRRRTEE